MARPALRKSQVLDYVQSVIAQDGVAPSYGMICDALNIRTRTEVCRFVRQLENEGLLKRVGYGRVRRIRLFKTPTIADPNNQISCA